MSPKAYTEQEEQLARFAKAMGHPARMAILRFLAGQDSCFFGDIHEVLPIAKATVSQHLKELKAAGLIQGEIEAPKVRYCINREILSFPPCRKRQGRRRRVGGRSVRYNRTISTTVSTRSRMRKRTSKPAKLNPYRRSGSC